MSVKDGNSFELDVSGEEFQYLYATGPDYAHTIGFSHLYLKMFRQACKMTMTCFQQSFFCYRHTFIFREQKLSLSTARNVQLVKRTFQLQKILFSAQKCILVYFFDSLTGCTNGLHYRIEIFVFQPLNSMLKGLFQKSNMLLAQN